MNSTLRYFPVLLAWGMASGAYAAPSPATATSARATSTQTVSADAQERAAIGKTRETWLKEIATLPETQREGAAYLVRYMPERDLTGLPPEIFRSNLAAAYEARERFPWCRDLPKEVFFNDVLPYAITSEERDNWRPGFLQQFGELVKDCKTAREAAIKISSAIGKETGVEYNVRRRAPDQSPSESIKLKMASCSGLSILLIDALRSVGIPSRMAGILTWAHVQGNHNWSECFIDGKWEMLEYGQNAFNTPWVIEGCGLLDTSRPEQTVWATSWKPRPESVPQGKPAFFPMVWKFTPQGMPISECYVNAIDVSPRYAQLAKGAMKVDPAKFQLLFIEVTHGGGRVEREVSLQDPATGKQIAVGQSKAKGADMREMLCLELPRGKSYTLVVRDEAGKESRQDISASDNASQVLRLKTS